MELEYVAGPVYNDTFTNRADLNAFSLREKDDLLPYAYTTTIEDFSWIGAHTLRLKSTLGIAYDSPSARGNKGFYKSVYSDNVTLKITNPCSNSIVNAD